MAETNLRELLETRLPLIPEAAEQIADAYKLMAIEARYRPAAPSDVFGNITAPLESLDLDAEAQKYAAQWWREENVGEYFAGSPDMRMRSALIYIIEAARVLCGKRGGADPLPARLLRLAQTELETAAEEPK